MPRKTKKTPDPVEISDAPSLLLEMDGETIDVSRLATMAWRKFERSAGCPICLLSDDELAEFHNSAIHHHGPFEPSFMSEWARSYPAVVIRSHFQHHCIFSEFIQMIVAERRKLRKLKAELEVAQSPDSAMYRMITSGNMEHAFAEVANDMAMVRDIQRETFKAEAEKQRDDRNDTRLAKTGASLLQTSESIGDFLIKVDRLQNQKSFKTVQAYMEQLRTGLLNGMLSVVSKHLQAMRDAMVVRFGSEEKANDFFLPYLEEIKKELRAVYLQFQADNESRWSKMNTGSE